MDKFYVTTSIPYVNAPPHIGFALELVQADVLARSQRQQGKNVFFLTGTDEHGAKIVKAAEASGLSPRDFVDGISEKFQNLDRALNITNDDFIRTTDQKRHWPSAQMVWEGLLKNGDLEKRAYKGLYCVGCEAFITSKDTEDGLCRIHKVKPEVVEEENWFFKLSSYTERIREAIESDRLEIIPDSRKNEILGFMKDGLQDVSFSRPSKDLSWGVPVPRDPEQTMYVWADALSNYISALGYPAGRKFKEFWPADVQLVGKDILRFHATIWPGMLLALGLQLPKRILVHGFLTVEGAKMSKSIGNVVDPFELIERYGADAVRHYLLREIPSTEDGDYSREKFEARYTADLANGLGNLVSRILKLAVTHNVWPNISTRQPAPLKDIEELNFKLALDAVWQEIQGTDKYIETVKPFALIKTDEKKAKEVIAKLVSKLWDIADSLEPFLPETSARIESQIREKKVEVLFPRIVS